MPDHRRPHSGLLRPALTVMCWLLLASACSEAPHPNATVSPPDVATGTAPLRREVHLDAELEAFQPAATHFEGELSSQGSDTMNNLMTLWSEAFRRWHPEVSVQVQGVGSSTAPPALSMGTVSFGPMSRRMKPREIESFRAKHGYAPTEIPVAIDALAVYVHSDNPVTGLTLNQLDATFSVGRRCGAGEAAEMWGDLGLEGPWSEADLTRFGRNSVSGTYGYFKQHVLCGGDFLPDVNEQPGSASVVQAVAATSTAIGYSGIGYRTHGVKALPLAVRSGASFQQPTAENALNGSYPLSRRLYIYVNQPPGVGLPAVEREFLRLILSRTGQQVVLKAGYVPLPAAVVRAAHARLYDA